MDWLIMVGIALVLFFLLGRRGRNNVTVPGPRRPNRHIARVGQTRDYHGQNQWVRRTRVPIGKRHRYTPPGPLPPEKVAQYRDDLLNAKVHQECGYPPDDSDRRGIRRGNTLRVHGHSDE